MSKNTPVKALKHTYFLRSRLIFVENSFGDANVLSHSMLHPVIFPNLSAPCET